MEHTSAESAFIETRARFAEGTFEAEMMQALAQWLGSDLKPYSMRLPGGGHVEIEGSDDEHRLLVQLVANTGAFKSQHRNKAVADMFKLLWLRQTVAPNSRLVLCVSDTVAQAFAPGGWVTAAAEDLGIEVVAYFPESGLAQLSPPAN